MNGSLAGVRLFILCSATQCGQVKSFVGFCTVTVQKHNPVQVKSKRGISQYGQWLAVVFQIDGMISKLDSML